MRLYLTLILFICITTQFAGAQKLATDLKFDQRLVNCEKKWVIFPVKPGETRYSFGFIYMDQTAGFTFDLKGAFTVDNNDHYLVDTPANRMHVYKYRISAGMPAVALIPANRVAELHVETKPSWVDIYYHSYTDTAKHNYQLGYNYNVAGACDKALTYLEPLYKTKPDYPGLVFELAYAYNDLKQNDKAIDVLKEALKKDDKNGRLYRELGFAYSQKNDTQLAIKSYTLGIDLAKSADDKSEMAYNLAMVYKSANNQDEYKNWMVKAKSFTAPNSRLYNQITSQGF